MTPTIKHAARRYRRPGLIVLLVLGLYATAGFVLVPWLLPRLASDAVRDVYDAELRLGRVAFNPFRFRLQIDSST